MKLFYTTEAGIKRSILSGDSERKNRITGRDFILRNILSWLKNGLYVLLWRQTDGSTVIDLILPGLKVFDFEQHNVLNWLAELMKHREADNSRRYRMLAPRFIEKYALNTGDSDVIRGWRANASYFYIAKAFVRDEVDIDILEDLLSLGGPGIQYCLKSKKSFSQLHEDISLVQPVDFSVYNPAYNDRDREARENMRELIDSDRNTLKHVFSLI